MIVFYFLLMLRVGRCSYDQVFETKTVAVGGDVRLTCPRKLSGSLFWIRLVSGDLPKILGRSHNFVSDPRIITTERPGTFVLHIKKARLSDTAVYYCVKTYQQHLGFLQGTDLRVEVPQSDPVHPEDPVTQQSSVLKTCPEEHSMCCFKAGSHQYHPSHDYNQGNGVGEHEKTPEGLSTRKFVDIVFKNVSSSDIGTCYLNITEAVNMWDLQKANTVLFLLCAALAISLIVIAVLIYTIKMKSCDCCNAAVALQTNAATASSHHQSQQRDEYSLAYYSPTFTKKKTS